METLTLDKIITSNPYLRTNTDIDSLKKSIETVGIINPLTINDKNELLAGGRRYQAAKELGLTEVPVMRVELSSLEQELVSIDENLVRTPLNKIELEQCLNRGREIYEQINPTAKKIDVKIKDLSPAEKKMEKQEDEDDTTSFAAITSEKTGLSKAVIKSAIKRDEASSDVIKKARGAGEISASQVNEIIKLDKKAQNKILPYIKEKSVKDVRKIVEQARVDGVDFAIQESLEMQELPTELKQLSAIVKRCNKQFSKILIEHISAEGEELDMIVKQVQKLKKQSSDFLDMFDADEKFYSNETHDFNEVESFQ